MLMPSGFDKANRKNRETRAYEKLEQIIERLKMTLVDINRDQLLSDKQKEKIKRKAKRKLEHI